MGNKYKNSLVVLTIILSVIGILALFSASAIVGQKEHEDVFYFTKRQLLQGIVVGGLMAFLASKISLNFWQKTSFLLLLFNVFLIILCFIPPFKVSGTHSLRWIKIGPISFQPSEFLKITYFAFLATVLSRYPVSQRKKIFGKPFLIYLISLGIISVLMFVQPSTGTVFIIALASLLVYFVAGLSLKQFIFLALIGILTLTYLTKVTPYRFERIKSFLEGERDPLKGGYHIQQSLIGIGSGGIFGRGFLKSIQKFLYLPESHTDSIFSIMAEEFGFIGSLFLIILYLSLILCGLKIANQTLNSFNKFFAVGLISTIGIQAFINIAVMTKIMPTTGVPLPFISYGSSALITNLVSIGILCKIAIVDS